MPSKHAARLWTCSLRPQPCATPTKRTLRLILQGQGDLFYSSLLVLNDVFNSSRSLRSWMASASPASSLRTFNVCLRKKAILKLLQGRPEQSKSTVLLQQQSRAVCPESHRGQLTWLALSSQVATCLELLRCRGRQRACEHQLGTQHQSAS